MLHALCLRHVIYNAWASERLAPGLLALPRAAFHQKIESSFPSIHATCCHLAVVGELWLSRWRGVNPTSLPRPEQMQQSAPELLERWRAADGAIVEFVRALPDPARSVHITNIRGEPFTHSYADMILHLVNHQSYHRGQIVTMLRALGAEPSAQDFIVYIREARDV